MVENEINTDINLNVILTPTRLTIRFTFQPFEKVHINGDTEVSIALKDNTKTNTPVLKSNFEELVKHYSKRTCLCVKLDFTLKSDNRRIKNRDPRCKWNEPCMYIVQVISAESIVFIILFTQVIENYLIENNAAKASIFGMGISPKQVAMFSKSAVIVIPKMGINGGIVSVIEMF